MRKLTQRKKDILKLICLPTKEIGKHLCITERSVKGHITALLNIFCAQNRMQLLVKAIKSGVINCNEIIEVDESR